MNSTKNNDILVGLLAGAALLSAVGLMYAPFATTAVVASRPIRVSSIVMLLVVNHLTK